ncbi:MAG: SURF1 family protein [Alphaproteobacteria bacterium]|nr:SURF1 family protein [Alphaproteobacteria bacterium]
MRFRPSLWLTLAALPVLAALVALGLWQMQRLAWKDDLNAMRAARLTSSYLHMTPGEIAARGADPALDLHPVIVTGRFDYAHEFVLQARARDGRAGRGLVTPLIDAGGRAAVLVDRGWLPPAGEATTWSRPEGEQRIAGWLSLPFVPGPFAVDNDPARGQWLTIDVPAMRAAAGLPATAALLVLAGPGATAESLPVARAPEGVLPSPHLGYAITWFGLAAALVVVWAATGIARGRQRGNVR